MVVSRASLSIVALSLKAFTAQGGLQRSQSANGGKTRDTPSNESTG